MLYKDFCKRIKIGHSGYTLVELMALLVILAILANLAWAGYRSAISTISLQQDADILARKLRMARQTAIMSGRECDVVFTASNAAAPSISYGIRHNHDISTVFLREGVTTVGTTFARDPIVPGDYSRSVCRFLPSGVPNQGGTVCLKNSKNRKLYIVVTPVTARIRVTETEPGT